MDWFYFLFDDNSLSQQIELSSSDSSSTSSSSMEKDIKCERDKRITGYVLKSLKKSNENFMSHYRMSKTKAKWLMVKYRKAWQTGLGKKTKPRVSVELAVLSTLWWLGNKGTYRSTGELFNMERGFNFRVVLRFCTILYRDRSKFIKWPRNDQLEAITYQFRRFPGVIGAIDGTHLEIPTPKNDNSYNNRKLGSSIQVQVVCDGNKRLLDVFCGYPGSCHDARVWKESPLYRLLSGQNPIPRHLHLLGDSAYPLDIFLMRPYRDNGNLTEVQHNFNTTLSSSRMIVENAIGLLKGKFRRLKFLEIRNIKNAKFYIMAAACLHNFILRDELVVSSDSNASTSSNGSVETYNYSSESSGTLPADIAALVNDAEEEEEEVEEGENLIESAIEKRDRIANSLAFGV